jgi:murein DD-endopeptidase MepM/ murein hydrolase activator NlpD
LPFPDHRVSKTPHDLHRPATHRRQAVRRQAQHHFWQFYRSRMHWSFVQNFARTPIHWRRERPVILVAAALVVVLTLVVLPGWASVVREEGGAGILPMAAVAVQLPPAPPPTALPPMAEAEEWVQVDVKAGQTMSQIFSGLGLKPSVLHDVVERSPRGKALASIKPGDRFAFRLDAPGKLSAIAFEPDDATRVTLTVDAAAIEEKVTPRAMERRVRMAGGRVEQSLFGAGESAGISDRTIMQMADVFGYDIDFAQDLRRGDEFAVMYEEIWRDGERLRDGNILAASFVNDGKRFVAYRFTRADGSADYFDADGRPLRKAFLRTPVEFSRISSRFASARRHPILGTVRRHQGVDYAAPRGTPIRSAGSGKIAFRGWKAGYGNCIIVQHANSITTLYGHMSGYARGVGVGSRVTQGETIGYVGMTGLATAPHLHYEFRLNGTHRDPLNVPLPKAEPLAGDELIAYSGKVAPLASHLGLLEQQVVVGAR